VSKSISPKASAKKQQLKTISQKPSVKTRQLKTRVVLNWTIILRVINELAQAFFVSPSFSKFHSNVELNSTLGQSLVNHLFRLKLKLQFETPPSPIMIKFLGVTVVSFVKWIHLGSD